MDENSYDVVSGTSIAVPHVVGLIALMLSENPKLSIQEINTMLIDNSLSIPGNTKYNLEYGYGLVQATKS
ncbi:MAG: S8 family serine peptidase [Paraclostridium sp.]